MTEKYTPSSEEIRAIIEEALGEELVIPTRNYSNAATDVEAMEERREKIIEGIRSGKITRSIKAGYIGSDVMVVNEANNKLVDWTEESTMAVELAIHDVIVGTQRMISFATELVNSGVSVNQLIESFDKSNFSSRSESPVLLGDEDEGVVDGEFTEV